MHDCIEEITNCGRTASLITEIRFELDWQSRFSRFIHDLTCKYAMSCFSSEVSVDFQIGYNRLFCVIVFLWVFLLLTKCVVRLLYLFDTARKLV